MLNLLLGLVILLITQRWPLIDYDCHSFVWHTGCIHLQLFRVWQKSIFNSHIEQLVWQTHIATVHTRTRKKNATHEIHHLVYVLIRKCGRTFCSPGDTCMYEYVPYVIPGHNVSYQPACMRGCIPPPTQFYLDEVSSTFTSCFRMVCFNSHLAKSICSYFNTISFVGLVQNSIRDE